MIIGITSPRMTEPETDIAEITCSAYVGSTGRNNEVMIFSHLFTCSSAPDTDFEFIESIPGCSDKVIKLDGHTMCGLTDINTKKSDHSKIRDADPFHLCLEAGGVGSLVDLQIAGVPG